MDHGRLYEIVLTARYPGHVRLSSVHRARKQDVRRAERRNGEQIAGTTE